MANLSAIILAAGKGTRMKSDLPKVAHEVASRPMVRWVADACAAAGCTRIVTVVGYEQDTVRTCLDPFDPPNHAQLAFAVQEEQHGTGHAVAVCREAFNDAGPDDDTFVLAGDGPLIRPETLRTLHKRHTDTGAAATLATARLDDPSGYGRVVRDDNNNFTGIVEQKNATPDQLTINEVNPSYYCFNTRKLFQALDQVTRDDVSGEYYITDVPTILMNAGHRVEVIDAVPAEDVLSINTPEQLAVVDRVMRDRLSTADSAGATP